MTFDGLSKHLPEQARDLPGAEPNTAEGRVDLLNVVLLNPGPLRSW